MTLVLATPLGPLAVTLDVGDAAVALLGPGGGAPVGEALVRDLPPVTGLELQLLVAPYLRELPDLPEWRSGLEECWAVVVHVRGMAPASPPLRLTARLPRPLRGEWNGGQGLAAKEFQRDGCTLVLGGADPEDDGRPGTAEDAGPEGLRWVVPAGGAGDHVDLHCAVAWGSGAGADHAAWLAVDVTPDAVFGFLGMRHPGSAEEVSRTRQERRRQEHLSRRRARPGGRPTPR